MIHEPDVCAVCRANDGCSDCLSGADPARPEETCVSCGGSGVEPPLLPSCSEVRCGVPLPGAGP